MSQPIFNIAPVSKIFLLAYILLFVALAYVMPDGAVWFARLAFTPADLAQHPYTLISYQLLHGGWLHLLVNSAMFAALGNAIEGALTPLPQGRLRFIAFVLLTGSIAALAEWALHPLSDASLVGASGSVSGMLGALLFLQFQRSGRRPDFIRQIFVLCIVMAAVGFFNVPNAGAPIAWVAHIGGFLGGILLWPVFSKGTR